MKISSSDKSEREMVTEIWFTITTNLHSLMICRINGTDQYKCSGMLVLEIMQSSYLQQGNPI